MQKRFERFAYALTLLDEEIKFDTMPEMATQDDISLLPAAADKIRSLLAERNMTGHGLRVFVAGGGCSGKAEVRR